MSQDAEISVNPTDSLADEKVEITISGLAPACKITINASLLSDGGHLFQSCGEYISNEDGKVLVSTDYCYGGSYSGIQQMGLLTTLSGAEQSGVRLFKKNVYIPYIVQLDVFQGHGKLNERLVSTKFRRHFMRPGVRRIMVKTGRIRGTMFIPAGKGPFPGVIDMFGTAGGIKEFKASLLASRGFAALSLAYFDYEDLPKAITNISLEYFEEALSWFAHHQMVQSGGVGLMGVSKGSELVLTLASYQPQLVRAIVGVSPAHAHIAFPLNICGKQSPFVKFEPEMTRVSEDGGLELLQTYPDNVSNGEKWHPAVIEVEKIQCPIMLVYGDDDKNWDSARMASFIEMRLNKHKKQCILKCYHGAGHLIEPPYSPHCKYSYHKTYRMHLHWGGEADKHCHAQEDSWPKIIQFFNDNLNNVYVHSNL